MHNNSIPYFSLRAQWTGSSGRAFFSFFFYWFFFPSIIMAGKGWDKDGCRIFQKGLALSPCRSRCNCQSLTSAVGCRLVWEPHGGAWLGARCCVARWLSLLSPLYSDPLLQCREGCCCHPPLKTHSESHSTSTLSLHWQGNMYIFSVVRRQMLQITCFPFASPNV